MNIFATKSVSSILCKSLDVIECDSFQYASGEMYVDVYQKNGDCFLVSSVTNNDDLIELILLINALQPAKITLILLYVYYSRSDKIVRGRTSNSCIIQQIIQNTGVSNIIHLDLHSNFFTTRNLAISAFSLFENDIASKKMMNAVIVAPDIGISRKAKKLAQRLNMPFIQCYKTRESNGVSIRLDTHADVRNKNCILVDDIIDSCDTMYKTGFALVENGANSLACYCVHGVLSRKSIGLLRSLPIADVVITDSINMANDTDGIRRLSVVPIIQSVVDGMLEEFIYE